MTLRGDARPQSRVVEGVTGCSGEGLHPGAAPLQYQDVKEVQSSERFSLVSRTVSFHSAIKILVYNFGAHDGLAASGCRDNITYGYRISSLRWK